MEFKEVGKAGFRYCADFERPDAALVAAFGALMEQTGCLTGNVGDCLGRNAAMHPRIKPLKEGFRVVGPALTVRVPPDDNLMIHKALTLVKPGDVLVIDGGGDHSCALLGLLMVRTAQKMGAAGMIVDGDIRDAAELRQAGFPVFAAGISPNGPSKEGPGEINFSISCGGRVVFPGDIIVADDDGVVVVGKEYAAGCIEQVKKVIAGEEKRLAEIAAGQTSRPGLNEILKQKGID